MKQLFAFAMLVLVALGIPQEARAYDAKRIKLFCAQVFRTGVDRRFCIRFESESGRILDQKRRSVSTPAEKRIAEQCHSAYARSYIQELSCFNRYTYRLRNKHKSNGNM